MKKYPLLSISLVLVIFIQLTSCSGEKYLSLSTPEPIKTSTFQPTATQIDLPTKTATITPTDLPTKTATITPTETPFPIERDSGGNFLPKPIAFLDTGIGKIKEIKDLDEPNPTIEKAFQEAKNKLNIEDDSGLQTANLEIVCENGRRTYMLVRDVAKGQAYTVFVKDENGFYLPPDSVGELVLLPLKTVSKEVQRDDGSIDQQELLGFEVNGNLLIPPTFSYSEKTGEFTYIDPKTGEQIVLTKETNTAPKMLAMLTAKNNIEKEQVFVPGKLPTPEQPLTPKQQARFEYIRKNLELGGYGSDASLFEVSFNADDKAVITDRVSGRVLSVDLKWNYLEEDNTSGKDQLEDGSWVYNPNLIKKLIDYDIEKTKIKPYNAGTRNNASTNAYEYSYAITQEDLDLTNQVEQLTGSLLEDEKYASRPIFVYTDGSGNYSWGTIVGKAKGGHWIEGKKCIVYKTTSGELKYIQVYYPNYLLSRYR